MKLAKGEGSDGLPNTDHIENYHTIKTTFIMGGSSVINIALGIIRHKVIALLLGSAGMGLLSLYQSISNLAVTVFGLGINESGARQVAISFKNQRPSDISRTSVSVKRTALVTGIVGVIILSVSSKYISILTFKDPGHIFDIALLSLTVLFGTIYGGQTALIQGARQISYLAQIGVLGPLWGTLLSLPIIYFLGLRGVVSYLIILSAANVLSSWWYSKKTKLPILNISWRESAKEAKGLVGLGTALMIGTIIGVAASFAIRLIIIRSLDLDAVGVFQASMILSSVYAGILFKAMATDFYPRLSAASGNRREGSLLVNQQIEVGLLMAVPGVLFTLTFAPLVMVVMYSSEFLPAVGVLKWQALGVLLQIITWPMGYILRARAAGKLFIYTELFGSCCYLVATWIGIRTFGLLGIGIAFFVYNSLYFALIYPIVHIKYGFSFNGKNVRLLFLAAFIVALSFLAISFFPRQQVLFNIPLICVSAYYSYKTLSFSAIFSKIIDRLKHTGRTEHNSIER